MFLRYINAYEYFLLSIAFFIHDSILYCTLDVVYLAYIQFYAAESFNYVNRFGNIPDISMMLNTVVKVSAHNSSSDFMPKLDFRAEPFIPGTISDSVILEFNGNRFQMDIDGDGISVSK